MRYTRQSQEFGIQVSHNAPTKCADYGNAHDTFRKARQMLKNGETVSLFAVSISGAKTTLLRA